jgi:hypothetical protein
VQTYSDGTVVQWNEQTPARGKEPEHPVPTLSLAAPPGTGGGSDSLARGLGIGGLVLGALALAGIFVRRPAPRVLKGGNT